MTEPALPSLAKRARQLVFHTAATTPASANSKSIFADYVIVFHFPLAESASSLSREQHESNVVDAFKSVLEKLRKVGLKYEVRHGEKNTLLIFVLCPWEKLKSEVYRSRVHDWLMGVRIADIDETNATTTASTLTESERLRLVHDIITGPVEDGAAAIVPGQNAHVQSILSLHDDQFDQSWVHSWSNKWLIQEEDFDKIRDHYGEKIGYYFAFLQFYFLSLIPPSVIGILVYLFSSNSYSVFFSFCMVLWSTLFVALWERRERELAVRWGSHHHSKTQRLRAAFRGEITVADPVTGDDVPHMPVWKTWTRRLASIPGIAVGAIGMSLVVSLVFTIELFLKEYYRGPLHGILIVAPTILYAGLIPSISSIYIRWSRYVNEWENHRTETDYEIGLVYKIFITNFLTGYLSLFIIAWVYIPFGDSVLPYLTLANITHEHKSVGPERLKAQLMYFVVTGQIINAAIEIALPYLTKLAFGKAKVIQEKIKGGKVHDEGEADKVDEAAFMKKVRNEVALREYDVYEDYAEMVVQFGYVSMFSTAWPLAPLCCLLNNWVELRSDAVKLCKYTRRPIPMRAESIGPWLGYLKLITWLSSITTSSFVYLFSPSTSVYNPLFALFSVFLGEHLFIALSYFINSLLSFLSSPADDIVRRQEYLLKKRWLDKVAGARELVDGTTVIEDEKQASQAMFWEAEHEEEDGMELIRSAFKNK